MGIERAFTRFGGWLRGWPGPALTLLLILLAGLLVYIALRGSSFEKAVAAAWVLFP